MLNPNLKWNSYILNTYIDKDAGKLVCSLCHTSKCPTPPGYRNSYKSQCKDGLFLLYMSTSREIITFQFWSLISASLWVRNYFPTYNPFPTDEAWQACRCFISITMENSGELHSLVPPVLTFSTKTHHITQIEPLFPSRSISEMLLPLEQLLPWTAALRNRLPRSCYPNHCNFNLLKSRVRCNLRYIPI